MIYEYAIDRELLLEWSGNSRDFSEFFREYGLGNPRIFSTFPKTSIAKFKSYLLKATPLDESSLAHRRYVEMVESLENVGVIRQPKSIISGVWDQDVIGEHSKVNFDFILSKEFLGVEENLTPHTMYEPKNPWNHPRQVSITRTQFGVLSVLSNLIRLSSQRIVIVDPYAFTERAISLIHFMLKILNERRVSPMNISFDVFYKTTASSPDASYVLNAITDGLDAILENVCVTVYALAEKEEGDVFHNRCVLSENGGVSLGYGVGVSDNVAHTDEATLLSKDVYEKKWTQFVEELDFEIDSKAINC